MTRKNPPVHREGVRTHEFVRGTGEGGEKFKYGRTIRQIILGLGSSRGAVFYWVASHPTSDFQVLPEAKSGSKTSDIGDTSRVESEAGRQSGIGWILSEAGRQ